MPKDSMKIKGKTTIDDGCAAFLVENAEFDGKWEIPIIYNDSNIKIPIDLVPFDKRYKVEKEKKLETYIHFYMHDITFKQVIKNVDKYIDIFREFGGVISPDCSLYVDMPLACQMINTYINRAIGYYIQSKGINVIPNVRWGDERSYEFCFLGVEHNGIYSIGTYGCVKRKEDKILFKKGLREMLKRLRPRKIIVYGTMPKEIFEEFIADYEFILYESYIEKIKRREV